MNILKLLGLVPSEEDKKLRQMVENTYSPVHVVGRGTVKIDPTEVRKLQSSSELALLLNQSLTYNTGISHE